MRDGKVYVGNTGTLISLNTEISLSDASLVQILILKPDGSNVTWTGLAVGPNIQYITIAGDIDQPGTWFLQASVQKSSGTLSGETVPLYIYPAFN